VVKIVTLTSTLSDSSENRVTSVVHGNVVNELHDNDSLSDSGSSEETNLSSLGVRSEEVNNLDSGDQNLLGLTLLSESRGSPVQGGVLLLTLNEDGSLLIDGLTNNVDDTSKGLRSYRNLNGSSGIGTLLTTNKTVGGLHSNGTDGVLSQVLSYLKNQTVSRGLDLKGIQNLWELFIELKYGVGGGIA
jgi:hypothetical protein